MKGLHDIREHSVSVFYTVHGTVCVWTSDYARTHGERAAAMIDYLRDFPPAGFVPLYSVLAR